MNAIVCHETSGERPFARLLRQPKISILEIDYAFFWLRFWSPLRGAGLISSKIDLFYCVSPYDSKITW